MVQNRVLTKEEKNVILTEENYEQSALLAIGHLNAYINKLAFKLSNSAGSSEDYKQELILKVWHVFRRYEKDIVENRKNVCVKDLINTGVCVAHNRYADLSAEFAKKTDTSLFTRKLDDVENSNPDKDFYESDSNPITPMFTYRVDPNEELEVNNLVEVLLKDLEDSEMPYETTSFVKEMLEPSTETLNMYDEWLRITNPKNPHKNKGIPPKVVCDRLGIEYSKMNRIKEIIGVSLIKLGMSKSQVFPNMNYPDSFWIQNGLKPPHKNKVNNYRRDKENNSEEKIQELAKRYPNLTLSKS